MQFADYNAYRSAVQRLIENDDTTSSTFSLNTLDLVMGLGESRVFLGDAQTAGLRASSMVKEATIDASGNELDLPADLLELKEVFLGTDKTIEIIQLDKLHKHINDGVGGARSYYAAQDGDTLKFWPQATGDVTIKYYARPPDLETINWTLATTFKRYPELFIFSTLYESALFLGMDDRVPAWESKYRALADGANHAERMRVYAGSPLRARPR